MAKNKEKQTKVIRVNESALVDLIDNIVTEAVASKKQEWIAEQEKKQADVISEQVDKILEDRLKKLFNSKS